MFSKNKSNSILVVKSKLPPYSGSVAFKQLKPIHKKGPQSFFLFMVGISLQEILQNAVFQEKVVYISLILRSPKANSTGRLFTIKRTLRTRTLSKHFQNVVSYGAVQNFTENRSNQFLITLHFCFRKK